MNIITGTKDDLKILIDGAYQRLRRSKDKFEKYALIDYLTELHGLESGLTGENVSFDERRAMLSNSQQRKYSKYMDYLFGRLDDEFIKFRDCHNEIFGTMLTINDDILDSVVEDCYAEDYTLMSEDEFCEYFLEFLKEYKLEEYFDKLITGRKIYSRELNDSHRVPGNVIHDPIKKRSTVVMGGFEYSVPYLLNLGHELGHVVDLSKLNKKDLETYLNYSYSSVYGEVVSSIFEKLFYDFLFRKKYRLDEVKEVYSEFLFENKNYILDGYIISLLEDMDIRKLSLNGLSNEEILKKIESSFTRLDEIAYHLDGRILSTWNTPLYAYGDYFSTVLKDDVHKNGFDGKMMRKFMNLRTGHFDPELFEDNGFEIEDYQKVYKRDALRLKK